MTVHPVTVLQRVPDGIVGDRLPAVGGHQILPGAVAVSITHRLGRRPQRPRGVGILLPLQQIPPDIVAVGGALVRLLAVHPHQLVQAVVGIRLQLAAAFDGLDVPHAVVGIGQQVHPFVVHRRQQIRRASLRTNNIGLL